MKSKFSLFHRSVRFHEIQFTNRISCNSFRRDSCRSLNFSKHGHPSSPASVHVPPLLPLLLPPRAMCIHLAWLTFPPWSNIIAMELVSNVQTSIKSLCHKGPGRWREVTALSTPARPGKEFTAWKGLDSCYNDLPEFSLPGQLLGASYFLPGERFQLIFRSKFHFPPPSRILNQFYRLSKDRS